MIPPTIAPAARPRWRVPLVAVGSSPNPEAALRRALKRFLRAYGLRCERLEEISPPSVERTS